MKSKDFNKNLALFFMLMALSGAGILTHSVQAQFRLSGQVISDIGQTAIKEAEVHVENSGITTSTDKKGRFELSGLEKGRYELIIFSYQYHVLKQTIDLKGDTSIVFRLRTYGKELSEVVISQEREEVFNLSRLKPVEGTAIYAGKKTEVIQLQSFIGNLASNNARQLYGQVAGLNIYENNDAGLQLNIGGRGLDPNRSANFNIRQNSYDISADVLGYPESYYTPPAEALEEIQVIRGAASLQYGTQFGGLINFKMKRPHPTKKIEWTTRQSLGSFGLFTSFNSLSGTIGNFSYYTYFNYKQGKGFRPNAKFDSQNTFIYLNYDFSEKTHCSIEATWLNYLAQQPGGLTDAQFRRDPKFSNRSRNWFEVDWRLYALKFKHKFSSKTDLSVNIFSLDAERNAVGFRGNPVNPNTNPVAVPEEQDGEGVYTITRDLIKSQFNNWGTEIRYLTRYHLGGKDAVFLIGTKYYHADNAALQGPGTNGTGPDFSTASTTFPYYPHQSEYTFPNLNLSLFGENIFFLSERFSLTPGFRFERIETVAKGTYSVVGFDLAGKPISKKTEYENRELNRSFVLLGLGASYQYDQGPELYANVSQNYRSVTFSDIRVVSPTFITDPNISDEKGLTSDLGLRGKWGKVLSYDLSGFALLYNDRIGEIYDGNTEVERVRKNAGDAFIYGIEAFADWNLISTFRWDGSRYKLSWFTNTALTHSEYIRSEIPNVTGNQVEFIPSLNLKSGLRFGYGNLLGSIQFTHLSEQFTDMENSPDAEDSDIRSGTIGKIPAYSILDCSLSYTYRKWRLESGLNNVLNHYYFTRRASGYPGPGITPADPRSFYTTLQFKL